MTGTPVPKGFQSLEGPRSPHIGSLPQEANLPIFLTVEDWQQTIRSMGLKSRKGIGGRPRAGENALSRWIDANLADGDDGLLPRERFAHLIGKPRNYVDQICGGRRPGLELILKIEELTGGAVQPRDFA